VGPVSAARNSFAVMLVIIGALLCFPASVALWEQRTLADEGPFVELGQDIIDEGPVQSAIARVLGEQVTKFAGVEAVTIRSVKVSIESIALEAVKSLAGSEAADAALRGTYHVSRQLADLEKDTVQTDGDDLVIDLRPTVRSVLEQADDEEPLLQGLVLPQNVGLITITEGRQAGVALDAWRFFDKAAPVLIVLPLILFVLAVIVASGRGFMLFLIGAAIAGGAALRIFMLQGPLDSLLEDLITGDSVYGDAGFAVYGRIVASYARQEVMVIIGGVVVAVVGLGTSVLTRS
jgi:hypothetical protein